MVTEKGQESHSQRLLIGYMSVLCAAVLFGSVFSLAKVPLSIIDPLALTAVVYTISGLALVPFAKGSFTFERKTDYFYVLIVTIFGGILAPILLMYGLQQTAASTAAIQQMEKLYSQSRCPRYFSGKNLMEGSGYLQ